MDPEPAKASGPNAKDILITMDSAVAHPTGPWTNQTRLWRVDLVVGTG
jgi:hypothetical protein